MARALAGGATGFLLKSGDPYELIAGVRAVAAGAAFLSPEGRPVRHGGPRPRRWHGRLLREEQARAAWAGPSPREREVLGLVGAGLSNPEIAARLHLVEGTVKAYVSAVLDRLGVRNRVRAAIVAYEAGLVES